MYASAVAGAHTETLELRPDDPQAVLFCGGRPCDAARARITRQRSSFPVYLAALAAEGTCLYLSARQASRVDSSEAGALTAACGLLVAADLLVPAFAVPLQGMFLKTSASQRFDLPVDVRFGATAVSLDPGILRLVRPGTFDVAKTIAAGREAGEPLLCLALRDPRSGGTFAALPLAFQGVDSKGAAPVVDKLREQLAQDLAPAHPVGPGKAADLFIEGTLAAGFKLDLRLFDGRSRYVLSSATASAPTLLALAEQVPKLLNDLYGSCVNEILTPARPPARVR